MASIRPDSSISGVSITIISELINGKEEKKKGNVLDQTPLKHLDRYLNLKVEWLITFVII